MNLWTSLEQNERYILKTVAILKNQLKFVIVLQKIMTCLNVQRILMEMLLHKNRSSTLTKKKKKNDSVYFTVNRGTVCHREYELDLTKRERRGFKVARYYVKLRR